MHVSSPSGEEMHQQVDLSYGSPFPPFPYVFRYVRPQRLFSFLQFAKWSLHLRFRAQRYYSLLELSPCGCLVCGSPQA